MKKYILYAGVNGAGKSTLYHTTNSQKSEFRINTDEILREIGDWRNSEDLLRAGKIAVRKWDDFLQQGVSFNQETTLCGKLIIRNIKKAKELGYLIEMHYVGVESVDIAIQRIAQRVAAGGHGIPDADVRRRYKESFMNLKELLTQCDLAALYDNTTEFRRFAIYKDGEKILMSRKLPEWYEKLMDI